MQATVCLSCKILVFPEDPEHGCDTPALLPLETYLKLMRPVMGQPPEVRVVGPSGDPKPQRGRPGLPVTAKDAALHLFIQGSSACEVARALYGVDQPTDRQIRNVYAILKQHEKTITGGKYPSELHLRRTNLRRPKRNQEGCQN